MILLETIRAKCRRSLSGLKMVELIPGLVMTNITKWKITIFNGKITMFNGKINYFYGIFQ